MQRINDLCSQVRTIFHCQDNHILVCSPPEPLPITPETLHSIRAKKERGELLTREEWQMFVHFIQIGSEFVRFASLPQLRLLRAFRAAFEICNHRNSSGRYLPYYLKSLPLQCQPWGWCETATTDMVREVIVATFEELACHPCAELWPLFPGRNLQIVLEYEPLIGIEALNSALLPHWDGLWPTAELALNTTQGWR
jgi:hypothetical protein